MAGRPVTGWLAAKAAIVIGAGQRMRTATEARSTPGTGKEVQCR